jgi:hypothetical protein
MKQRCTKQDVRSDLKNVVLHGRFIFPSYQGRHRSLGTVSLITVLYRSQKRRRLLVQLIKTNFRYPKRRKMGRNRFPVCDQVPPAGIMWSSTGLPNWIFYNSWNVLQFPASAHVSMSHTNTCKFVLREEVHRAELLGMFQGSTQRHTQTGTVGISFRI